MQPVAPHSKIDGYASYKEPFSEEDNKKCISAAKESILNMRVYFLDAAKEDGCLTELFINKTTNCANKYLAELDSLITLSTSEKSNMIQLIAQEKVEKCRREILIDYVSHPAKL